MNLNVKNFLVGQPWWPAFYNQLLAPTQQLASFLTCAKQRRNQTFKKHYENVCNDLHGVFRDEYQRSLAGFSSF